VEELSWENDIYKINSLKQEILKKLQKRIPYQRQITSTIDWQDRASMIWLREAVQNSRDAILKAQKNWNTEDKIDDINIDFYQNNNSWTSRITDNIWMTSYEVFKYLLIPWLSWKTWSDWATWMFGQWFYSLVIWAKEINVKTSIWDWKTTYIKLIPIYNENKDIIDFTVNYDIKDEEFRWTIIERTDENEWIWWNIWALVWINNLEKYVWNVDDVDISYNSQNIYLENNITIFEEENIPELWTLSLKQNKDKQERLTKDNLFLSEIKDEYLDFLPDFIIDYISKNGYSLDLPADIKLLKTRNAVTDFEENLEILKPHIFNIFTRHIIKEYLKGNTRLPMMPLDYYGLDLHELTFNSEIVNLAKKVNSWKNLSEDEILKLKDKSLMIQYLINLQVENDWEIVSIRELKKRRDDEDFLKRHTSDTYAINNNALSLNIGMERWDREKINIDKNDNSNDKKIQQELLEKSNIMFSPVVKRLFWKNIDFWIYQRNDKNENRAVDYWFDKLSNIYFNFNNDFVSKFNNDENYKLIELITHELTHLVEDYVKWYWIDFDEVIYGWMNLVELTKWKSFNWEHKFWTHQKDLWHAHSFEKIQRDILKLMTREGL